MKIKPVLPTSKSNLDTKKKQDVDQVEISVEAKLLSQKAPTQSYIKRGIETVSVQIRIDSELKHEAEKARLKLGTSLNRLVEAAIKWYLVELKKEGSL